jgi:hypothetical protein
LERFKQEIQNTVSPKPIALLREVPLANNLGDRPPVPSSPALTDDETRLKKAFGTYGDQALQVINLIDGKRTVSEIATSVGLTLEQVKSVFVYLTDKGFIMKSHRD